MTKLVPINKATGQRYPAIGKEDRTAMEADRILRGKYRFEEIEVKAPKPAAPAPTEAAKVSAQEM